MSPKQTFNFVLLVVVSIALSSLLVYCQERQREKSTGPRVIRLPTEPTPKHEVVIGDLSIEEDMSDPMAGPEINDPSNIIEPLSLALAKLTVNEAGFNNKADMLLIWQASGRLAEGMDSEYEERVARLRWLENHSRKVLGTRRCPEGHRCRWTRHLEWNRYEPLEYPGTPAWEPQDWFDTMNLAMDIVLDGGKSACKIRPHTWEGRKPKWMTAARNKGFVQCHCKGTKNEGWQFPRKKRRRG